MVTVGLGGAGDAPAVTGGGPLPGTRPFGLPGTPKLGSRGTGAALLLENTGPVPFPVGQTKQKVANLIIPEIYKRHHAEGLEKTITAYSMLTVRTGSQ